MYTKLYIYHIHIIIHISQHIILFSSKLQNDNVDLMYIMITYLRERNSKSRYDRNFKLQKQ